MDKRIEDATVIAYAERELAKMKEAREDDAKQEGAEDPEAKKRRLGRETLLRDVIRDRIRASEVR